MRSKLQRGLFKAFGVAVRGVEWLRYRYYDDRLRVSLRSCGEGVVFEAVSSKFVTPEIIEIGEASFINGGAHLSGEISIGRNVMVGPSVMLLSGNHIYAKKGFRPRYCRATMENPESLERIVIEDDVWIGARSVLLGALTIGCGAVIGAASVVTRDAPPYAVSLGNPAKAVRRIFSDAALLEHLALLGMPPAQAGEVLARRISMLAGAGELPAVEDSHASEGFWYCWPSAAAPRWIPKAVHES